jgi:hypothetical protein
MFITSQTSSVLVTQKRSLAPLEMTSARRLLARVFLMHDKSALERIDERITITLDEASCNTNLALQTLHAADISGTIIAVRGFALYDKDCDARYVAEAPSIAKDFLNHYGG